MENEDITNLLLSLQLDPDEEQIAYLGKEDIVDGGQEAERSIIGKFITLKPMVVKGLRTAIAQAWDSDDLKVIKISNNVFQFVLPTLDKKNAVLEGAPWCFDDTLLVIKPWARAWEKNPTFFDHSPFWFSITDLPREYVTLAAARRIASDFTNCVECQVREVFGTGARTFRFRADVDVTKPIRRFLKVGVLESNGEPHVGIFRYERLPHFCFQCGNLTHTQKNCPKSKREVPLSKQSSLPYGAYLAKIRNTVLLDSFSFTDAEVEPTDSQSPTQEVNIASAGDLVLSRAANVQREASPPTINNPTLHADVEKGNSMEVDVSLLQLEGLISIPVQNAIMEHDLVEPSSIIKSTQNKTKKFKRAKVLADKSPNVTVLGDITNQLKDKGKRKIGELSGEDKMKKPKVNEQGVLAGMRTPMSLICWNCRGLGRPRAVRALRGLIKVAKPDLVFLSETKSTERRMSRLRIKLGFDGCFAVERRGIAGGLCLLWKTPMDVTVRSFSQGHIDADIVSSDGQLWRFTGFYGCPYDAHKRESWELLRRLHHTSNLPWLCGGDFNQVLYSFEKEGRLPPSSSNMNDFQEVLNDCNLDDLGYNGSPFTWSNKRDDGLVKERLDRAVASFSWRQLYPTWRVEHLGVSHSDHLPIRIILAYDATAKKKWKPIQRFDTFWLRDTECGDLFDQHWHSPATMSDMLPSIEGVRSVLRRWSQDKYGSLSKNVGKARANLQSALDEGGATDRELIDLQETLGELEVLEEEYWHQRSREDWLMNGDRNTRFFHQKASARKETNHISSLEVSEGVIADTEEGICNVIRDYFQNIFTAQHGLPSLPTDLQFKRLNADDCRFLDQPYTNEEILQALQQMSPNKAPGPDGMQPVFLQKFWHVIGNDVLRLALSFLNDTADIGPINSTFLCLIPKIKNPKRVSEFRPIGLCNSFYKLISRTIVNRLKRVIASVIDESQSAFISDRLITDNAIIAFEAFHSMQTGRGGASNCMALKLDLSKAFDRVEWGYLQSVMEAMHFPARFISLIMSCITTVSISILVNGQPTSPFRPTRGIRQGDPLSPFLFLICAEGLSALIRTSMRQNKWPGLKFGRAGPTISHLLFADDSLLFFDCTPAAASEVRHVLATYTRVSGQQVNLDKSQAYFPRNTPAELECFICHGLGVKKGDGSGRYLGLPFMTGRSKKDVFRYVEEKVRKKVGGWKEKLLSQAGKEVLIKSIIQAIPSYIMQCFTLPASVCSSIESMTKLFWWRSSTSGRPIYWKSWKALCMRKQDGGMGFRDVRSFNLALLAKQGWRLIQRPNSLVAQVLQSKYYSGSTFMEARLGHRPSYLWRSILDGRQVLALGVRYRIGDGTTVDIWKDSWVPKPPSFKIVPVNQQLLHHGRVSDLIDWDLVCWKEDLVRQLFLPHDVNHVLKIPISIHGGTDRLIWHWSKSGIYTVKSGHHAWREEEARKLDGGAASASHNQTTFWTWLWKLPIQPKIRIFAWRCVTGILPTNANMYKRKLSVDTACPLCWDAYEDEIHCLLGCRRLGNYWADFLLRINHEIFQTSSFWNIMDALQRVGDMATACSFINGCWIAWKFRCGMVFDGEAKTTHQLLSEWEALDSCDMAAQNRELGRQVAPAGLSTWIPPSDDTVSVNVDAAFGSKGEVACGIIIRNSKGEILSSASLRLPSHLEVKHGELLAIEEGLRLAHTRGDTRVEVWSDSLNAVQEINGSVTELHPLASLIMECKTLATLFLHCRIDFVKRIGNQPAHLLAKLGLQIEHSTSWGHHPPLNICTAVMDDLNPY